MFPNKAWKDQKSISPHETPSLTGHLKQPISKKTSLPLLLLPPHQTKYLPHEHQHMHLDFACHPHIHLQYRYRYHHPPPCTRPSQSLQELQQLGLWGALPLYQQQPKVTRTWQFLKHQHNNNEHNNHNYNNKNTVSATHTQENLFLLPTPAKVVFNVTTFVSNYPGFYFSAIYSSKLFKSSEDTRCGILLNHRTIALSRLNLATPW